jgi:hypothetical protein
LHLAPTGETPVLPKAVPDRRDACPTEGGTGQASGLSYRARIDGTPAVAQFAEILRGNDWAKYEKMSDVDSLLFNVQRALPFDQDVSEFLGLVEQASRLTD